MPPILHDAPALGDQDVVLVFTLLEWRILQRGVVAWVDAWHCNPARRDGQGHSTIRCMPAAHFTEPTTSYWQTLLAPGAVARPDPPWQFAYPAVLPDGRVLKLPIRALAATPDHAVASLLLNQASLAVVDTLGEMLAASVAGLGATRVVGLPTLGLTLASVVARELGHARYLPMGYSRKFWYDEALSAPVSSITSPTPGKRIYLDPHLL